MDMSKSLSLYKLRLATYFRKSRYRILKMSYQSLIGIIFVVYFVYAFSRMMNQPFFVSGFEALLLGGLGFLALVNFLVAYFIVTHREKQLHTLRKLAVIDQLTGLNNKGFFLTKLNKEVLRSTRYNHFLSLIIMDLDHFKKLNDTYGHICGDLILRSVAKIVQAEIRLTDSACRFGGEEFTVICPETSIHDAKMISDRVIKRVNTKIFQFQNKPIKVTLSAGITHLDPLKPISDKLLFQHADYALYVAKSQGRNRSVIYSSRIKREKVKK